MEIKTKYNVGDEVYFIDCITNDVCEHCGSHIVNKDKLEVKKGVISIISLWIEEGRISEVYHLNKGVEYGHSYPETHIFKAEQEALEELNKCKTSEGIFNRFSISGWCCG